MSNKDTTTKTTSGKWQWFLWGAASTLVVTMIFDEVVGLSKIRKGFANLEPEPTISTTPTPGPQSTPSEQTVAGNEAILKNARVSLQFLQAYGFNRAIAEAGQVEPNAPLYSEAREDITRWSETILDIALGRAADGNQIDAIGTAQLVPEDDPSAYVRAQQLIEQWKIQIGREKINSALLAAAKGLINPQLASSYHRSIAILGQINPQQPGYEEAMELIRQWSEAIYLMAMDLAAQGDLQLAIDTAALIPENTPFYETAQKAITQWKESN